MNFELTEEQQLVKEAAHRFLEAELAPLDKLHGDREMTRELAVSLLKKLEPFGYVGSERVEDPITASVLWQELGRVFPSLAGIAFIAGSAARAVASWAHSEHKRLSEELLASEVIGCMAYSEPAVGSDPSAIACRAERRGDNWVINGSKLWISNGHIADVAIVTAQTDSAKGVAGLKRLIVDRRVSPFTSRDVSTIGLRAFPTSELHFDDVRVPLVNELGFGREPRSAPRQGGGSVANFNGARVLCADVSCGIAEHAIEVATRYVQERRQFGREIGRFQLVQGLIADMVMDWEAARLLTFRARATMDGPDADRCVSIAKAFATEMGVRVTSKAMECLGAMGLAEETGLERRFRDARMWIVPDGTAQIQRLIIGRAVTGLSAVRG